MTDRACRTLQFVGASYEGFQHAIQRALDEAHRSASGFRWFEVRDVADAVVAQRRSRWQVTVTVGWDEASSAAAEPHPTGAPS